MGGWGVTYNLCGFAGEAGEVDALGTVWVSCWVETQEVVQLVRMLSGASVIGGHGGHDGGGGSNSGCRLVPLSGKSERPRRSHTLYAQLSFFRRFPHLSIHYPPHPHPQSTHR